MAAPYTGRCAVVGCDRVSTHISFRHKGVYHGARIPEVSRLPLRIDDTHRRICFQCLDLHRRQSGKLTRENGATIAYFDLPHRYHTTPRSKSMYDYEDYKQHPCVRITESGDAYVECSPESGFKLVDPNKEHRELVKAKREAEKVTAGAPQTGLAVGRVVASATSTGGSRKRDRERESDAGESRNDSEEKFDYEIEEFAVSPAPMLPRSSAKRVKQEPLPPGSFIYTVNHRYTAQMTGRPQTVVTDILAHCADLHRANLIALTSMATFDVGSLNISMDDGLVTVGVSTNRDFRSYEIFVDRTPIEKETSSMQDVDRLIAQLRGSTAHV